METSKEKSKHLKETVLSVLFLLLAQMLVAPIGSTSNGGVFGLVFLLIATYLSWKALVLNNESILLRILLQCPLTVLMSFTTISNIYCQCVSGWWLGI